MGFGAARRQVPAVIRRDDPDVGEAVERRVRLLGPLVPSHRLQVVGHRLGRLDEQGLDPVHRPVHPNRAVEDCGSEIGKAGGLEAGPRGGLQLDFEELASSDSADRCHETSS